jgi:ArsR family metal-binding transcriptional regulator
MAIMKKIVKKADKREKKSKNSCLQYNVRTLTQEQALAKGVHVHEAWKYARGLDKIASVIAKE